MRTSPSNLQIAAQLALDYFTLAQQFQAQMFRMRLEGRDDLTDEELRATGRADDAKAVELDAAIARARARLAAQSPGASIKS